MAHGAGSGDKLARGAVKASYLTTEKAISQKKWDSMFEGFDPEEFMKKEQPTGNGEKEAVRSRR